jgi:uncharacterized membrane protein
VAALAYVLLPLSGLIAYFNGGSPRLRFHGLQAIAFGLLWPAALYCGTAVSRTASQAAWALGAIVWVALMLLAGIGKDVRLPLIGRWLAQAAVRSPKGER